MQAAWNTTPTKVGGKEDESDFWIRFAFNTIPTAESRSLLDRSVDEAFLDAYRETKTIPLTMAAEAVHTAVDDVESGELFLEKEEKEFDIYFIIYEGRNMSQYVEWDKIEVTFGAGKIQVKMPDSKKYVAGFTLTPE